MGEEGLEGHEMRSWNTRMKKGRKIRQAGGKAIGARRKRLRNKITEAERKVKRARR